MKIEARYLSQNPSNDSLMIFQGHEPMARINDQTFLDLLGPVQQRNWFNGESVFNIDAARLRESCDKQYARF